MTRRPSRREKIGEDRIRGGPCRFVLNPLLHQGETLGGLVDVVAVGDVVERLQQLFEAIGAFRSVGGRNAENPVTGCNWTRTRQRAAMCHRFPLRRRRPAVQALR